MGRFETDMLTLKNDFTTMALIDSTRLRKAMRRTKYSRIIIDMVSSESPVHGEQEGSAYSGHLKNNCFHPLFCFNQFGDCEGAMLRLGDFHSADSWKELLEPIVKRYRHHRGRKHFK